MRDIELKTKEVYEDNALSYYEQRDKSLFEKKWLDKFIINLRGHCVLDIGCGPADPIAKYLIKNNLDVTGTDYSFAMIEMAKKNFPKNNWYLMDMRQLNMGTKFDGILAWNSFFHLNNEDQIKTLDLFGSHLKSGGVLMFTAGPDKGEVLGKVNGQSVYHSSLSTSEYIDKLAEHSIKLIEHKLSDSECNYHSVYLWKKA